MLPPHVYEDARRTAPFHLQVVRGELTPFATPSTVSICARVERVLRGNGIVPGDEVLFELPVARRNDSLPVGPTIWADYDALVRCQVLELFLEGIPPSVVLARGQFMLLEQLTADPVLNAGSATRSGTGSFWYLLGRIWQRLRGGA